MKELGSYKTQVLFLEVCSLTAVGKAQVTSHTMMVFQA